MEGRFAGRVIAPGVAIGRTFVEQPFPVVPPRGQLNAGDVGTEIKRLAEAVALVRRHLDDHIREIHAPKAEDLHQVVTAHLLILDDRHFFDTVGDRIRQALMPAEQAVEEAFCAAVDQLTAVRDAYIGARAEDLRDVCQTLQVALVNGDAGFSAALGVSGEAAIFVSANLRVSCVLRAVRSNAAAFVTSSQAYSAHGAILLRACGMPSVGGVQIRVESLKGGAPILVDAVHGEVVVDPSPESIAAAKPAARTLKSDNACRVLPPLDASSADGERVRLWANIDNPSQVEDCLSERLHGMGLFRTEFLVLMRGHAPDEDEQYDVYHDVVNRLAGRPVVIRTFDIGADKVTGGLSDVGGANPALGVRGLRRHLIRRPRELRTQLRAVLRATVDAEAAVLLPMVTDVIDIQGAREHLRQVMAELASEGIPHNTTVKLGAMVEIPAAALRVRDILGAVDFISIGTNDLSQYLSAADRNNAAVAGYLRPETSGLMDLLAWVFDEVRAAGRQHDTLVGGELASDPAAAARFAEVGCRALIVAPQAADAVRQAIAGTFLLPTSKAAT